MTLYEFVKDAWEWKNKMFLVVGLGNPGTKYNMTRHNVGFMFLDYLATENGFKFSDSKWQAKAALSIFNQHKILFLKPETFMNLSGMSVVRAASYYKIIPERIVVIHDDLDLEVGRVKLAFNRGDGGHKGIRSISGQLGTKEFSRIKIGIGRPQGRIPVENYVLSKFSQEEREILADLADLLERALSIILDQGIAAAMTEINSIR
jgi:PTH1 family peptidyl-tRNA hydrolase